MRGRVTGKHPLREDPWRVIEGGYRVEEIEIIHRFPGEDGVVLPQLIRMVQFIVIFNPDTSQYPRQSADGYICGPGAQSVV